MIEIKIAQLVHSTTSECTYATSLNRKNYGFGCFRSKGAKLTMGEVSETLK